MVHQHFMLIPVMTVAENIVLGDEPTSAGSSSTTPQPTSACASLPMTFDFNIDPTSAIDG